jgi:ABC transporter substrate binding protein
VSSRWIGKLAKAGVLPKLTDGTFDLDKSRVRYLKHLRDEARCSDKSDAAARAAQARARQLELRLAKEEAELIEITAVEEVIDDIIGIFNSELIGVPAACSRDMASATGRRRWPGCGKTIRAGTWFRRGADRPSGRYRGDRRPRCCASCVGKHEGRPIVMATIGDPIAAGLVTSIAWPGGNITGLSLRQTELSGKRLQLLKQAFPDANAVRRSASGCGRVGASPSSARNSPQSSAFLDELRAVGHALANAPASARMQGPAAKTQGNILRRSSATGTRPNPSSCRSFLHDLQERMGEFQLARTGDQSTGNKLI